MMATPEDSEVELKDEEEETAAVAITEQFTQAKDVQINCKEVQQFRDTTKRVVVESQEIVQNVQKEPLYLLTLKREKDD